MTATIEQIRAQLTLAAAGHRHEQRGYFSLAELPQKQSVHDLAVNPGIDTLAEIWKLYPGQFTIVTGTPGHGKSTLVLNVVCNVARAHGWGSFLYVPENEGYLQWKLKRIYGDGESYRNFAANQCFVQSAEVQSFDQAPKSLSWVLERAVVGIKRDGVKLLVIDPWNELEHAKPRDYSMTDYITECLMMMKQFLRAYNVAMILVAHPTKAHATDQRKPTLYDVEGCYSDDTEVLTRRGWLDHSQVTLTDDIACFDPATADVVYAQPSKIWRKDHVGELYCFRGTGYDLAVTPNHRMLVKPMWEEPIGAGGERGRPVRFPKGRWTFCQAQDLPSANFSIPLAGNAIAGAEPETVIVGSRTYPAATFWRLVGWYVAEGHVGPTGLTWAQAEGALAQEFTCAFENAGIPAHLAWQEPHGKGKQRVGRWYIGNRFCRDLVEWFRINCGEGAAKKRVPDAVFELSPRLKKVFLAAYLQGDGTSRGDGFSAVTVSRRLRDDLQRLAVELGIPTNSGERAPVGNSQRSYQITFGHDGRREVTLRTQRNLDRADYSGVVWCLTVPTGAFFVRRNGRVSVSGNSAAWFNKCDNGLIVSRDPENNYMTVNSAKVRERGAGKRGQCVLMVNDYEQVTDLSGVVG